VAVFVALTFLVAPSLSRLVFLLHPPLPADPTDAAFVAHRPTGLLHVVPGLVMVALMPVQGSARMRRRWPALHRWSGRVFVLAGLTVSVTAAVMNVVFPVVGGMPKLTVIGAMCVAQVATLALGLRAIWRRDVAGHRRWMVRAMGVTLSAGGAGLFAVPLFAAGLHADVVVGVGRWLGFIATLAAVEWWHRTGDGAGSWARRASRSGAAR